MNQKADVSLFFILMFTFAIILNSLCAFYFAATVNTLFLATISADTITISEEPIIFDTAPINHGGHYNTVLGAYTAPYTGYYQCVFIIGHFTLGKDMQCNFRSVTRSIADYSNFQHYCN